MRKICNFILLVCVLLLTACGNEKQNGDISPVNDNDRSITTFGVIKCMNIKNIAVPFNTSIRKLFVSDGQRLVKGQSILELDLSEYIRQLNSKQSEIDNLKLQSKNLSDKLKVLQEKNSAKAINLKKNISILQERLDGLRTLIKEKSSPEYKKAVMSLEAAEKDYFRSNSELAAEGELYRGGAISLREYQEGKRGVEAKKRKIDEIKLDIAALRLDYKSEAGSLEISINQSKNDLAALETDMLSKAGELQASILQNKRLLAEAETDMKHLKDTGLFFKDNCLYCDFSRGVISGIAFIPGDIVKSGSIIANVSDTDSLYIEADIEEQAISGVRANSVVHITPETDKTKFYSGKVKAVSSMAIQKNNETLISVVISIDKPDEFLIPNSNAKVKILAD